MPRNRKRTGAGTVLEAEAFRTTTAPLPGQTLVADANGDLVAAFAPAPEAATFGDGSDGDVVLGAGTTTLSKDKFYRNLTVPSGATLACAGFRVFVSVTATVAAGGIVSADGLAASMAASRQPERSRAERMARLAASVPAVRAGPRSMRSAAPAGTAGTGPVGLVTRVVWRLCRTRAAARSAAVRKLCWAR